MNAKDHFLMLAGYNSWANARLYGLAGQLTVEEYNRDMGAFFKSMSGTLNHILVADYLWMNRLTGEGPVPEALDTIPYPAFADLWQARQELDMRIKSTIADFSAEYMSASCTYTPISSPVQTVTPVTDILTHLFNHQTHHRGQAHTILTALGRPSAIIDLIYFMRERAH